MTANPPLNENVRPRPEVRVMRTQTLVYTKLIGQHNCYRRSSALSTSFSSPLSKLSTRFSQAARFSSSCTSSLRSDRAKPMALASAATEKAADKRCQQVCLLLLPSACVLFCSSSGHVSQDTVPAPWLLQGDAFLLPSFKTHLIKQYDVNPLPTGKHWGGAGGIILARYHDTSVGPYSELIFSSGLYRLGRHVGFHIDQIYVDSQLSLLGGRSNWAVPKELAEFEWQTQGKSTQVEVSLPGRSQPFLTASFDLSKLHIPASSAVVPSPLKSILQACHQQKLDSAAVKHLSTEVTAAGSLHALSAIKVQTDKTVVPDSKELGIWRTGISLAGFHGSFGKPTAFNA